MTAAASPRRPGGRRTGAKVTVMRHSSVVWVGDAGAGTNRSCLAHMENLAILRDRHKPHKCSRHVPSCGCCRHHSSGDEGLCPFCRAPTSLVQQDGMILLDGREMAAPVAPT